MVLQAADFAEFPPTALRLASKHLIHPVSEWIFLVGKNVGAKVYVKSVVLLELLDYLLMDDFGAAIMA